MKAKPPSPILVLTLVLSPVVVTLVGFFGWDASPLLFPSLGAIFGAFGSYFLAHRSSAHPDNLVLRRATALSFAALVVPLTALLGRIFAAQAREPEIGVLVGLCLAVTFAAWLATSFWFEAAGFPKAHVSPLGSPELRRHLYAAFMLGVLLPLLMFKAVEFFRAQADVVIPSRSVVIHVILIVSAILVIAWWCRHALLSRSLIAGLGITVLLALPLWRLEPASVLAASLAPFPSGRDLLPVVVIVPAVAALIYWWLQTPAATAREGFASGFLVGAMPALSLGTSVAALYVWTPAALRLLEATGAPPQFWREIIVGHLVEGLVATQLINLLPPLLLGLVGMARAEWRDADVDEGADRPGLLPPVLAGITVAGGLFWMVNTAVVTVITEQTERWISLFPGPPPLPLVTVEWLGIFPSAAAFLIAFALLMWRGWRRRDASPLAVPVLLGLGVVGVAGVVLKVNPRFLPIFPIFAILAGCTYLAVILSRRWRLGAPLAGSPRPAAELLRYGLTFGLAAGATSMAFSTFAPSVFLLFALRRDGALLEQLRVQGQVTLGQITPILQDLSDLWLLTFGVWAMVTLLWLAVSFVGVVVYLALHPRRPPA